MAVSYFRVTGSGADVAFVALEFDGMPAATEVDVKRLGALDYLVSLDGSVPAGSLAIHGRTSTCTTLTQAQYQALGGA